MNLIDLGQWLTSAAVLAVAVAVALVAHYLLFALGVRALRLAARGTGETVLVRLRPGARLLLVVIACQFALPAADLDPAVGDLLRHGLSLVSIGAVVWMLVAAIRAGAGAIEARYDTSVADNLEARRVQTQLVVLERTAIIFVVVVGVAAALMTFPRVREFGASLLVSAGFAGLVLGLAARPVLENLIAGLQLALTQPVRIDDVVVVEDEWGRVEEITATYVVIRIWDERRLIVPFASLISRPFQNWTRRSADILGTVFIHADYTVPVEALRRELRRICEGQPGWDGRICVLQVTDTGPRSVELRALVSARDSGSAWNLRVAVREELLGFLQRDYPECLPTVRVSLREGAGTTVSPAG